MTNERWGVWGGRNPGGWCYFYREHSRSLENLAAMNRGEASVEWGTRLEAEELKSTFCKEMAESSAKGHDVSDRSYCVAPWDDTREPPYIEAKPSEAQKKALEFALKHQTVYGAWYPEKIPHRATVEVLLRNGWVMNRSIPKPITRVTAAGMRALTREPK